MVEIITNSTMDLVEDKISNNQENRLVENEFHPLNNEWAYWAHLPHDTDWRVESYKKVLEFDKMEQIIALNEMLPEKLVKNCMLFIMKKGIKPIWEDAKNRDGGCFSYKILNKNVFESWKSLTYSLVGESLTKDIRFIKTINGITISPKKSFCIIKIWCSTNLYQDSHKIVDVKGLSKEGCLFKKHTPEY
jgi:hypothetical protein